jgi:hypothetical protein
VTNSKPEQLEDGSAPPGGGDKPPERPGAFALVGLLVGIAAVIVAALLVSSARLISAGLLLFAGITLIVLWAFSHATESRRFGRAMTAAVIAASFGAGGYLFVSPVKPAAVKIIREPVPLPKAPELYFEQGTSAPVPYCSAYAISVKGPVPAGFQVVVFDAPTDIYGNVIGSYNFDQQPKPDPNTPGRLVDPAITVGSNSPAAGFRAVVIAAVIADKEAGILEAIKAAPTGWGLKNLPDLLTSKKLEVTRTSKDSPC